MQEQPNNAPLRPSGKKKKWLWIVAGIIVLLAIAGAMNDEKSKTPASFKTVNDTVSEPPANTTEVKSFDIAVTNQTIKKVDNKYRYFFDIRNSDTKDFDGEVSIILLNAQNTKLGQETFNVTKSIESKVGNSVYIDINTGPVSAHGEYGVVKFTYEVKSNNAVVKTGGGIVQSDLAQ